MTPEKFAELREKKLARQRTPEYLEKRAAYICTPEYRKKHAARMRERYATDPEFREREAARVRLPEYQEKQRARKRERYALDAEFRERHAAYMKDYQREYQRNRRANDPLYASKTRLRNRTRDAFNRLAADKPASTEELLGTDWQTLKAHIESQFVAGMGWENMSDWHIDHIIPLASAKTEEELAALCRYTNLQPLFALDNIRKGAKLPHELP